MGGEQACLGYFFAVSLLLALHVLFFFFCYKLSVYEQLRMFDSLCWSELELHLYKWPLDLENL